MNKTIKIFDTTLRDGEQSPGCSMNKDEKIAIARKLEEMGADIIEAGFPIASKGDFEAVQAISRIIKNSTVAALARAIKEDIDAAWEAIKEAPRHRIHTFLATSDIHMEYKLKSTPDEVYEQAVSMVKYAKNYCDDIEFSAEDASRTRPEFLYRIIEGVIDAGATTINVPDTVGYTMPEEYYQFICDIKENVPNIGQATISVHCHNDLGMAVANSLAAVRAGAGQVECAVNGIGERAGNAALEEIVMSLVTRKDIYNVDFNIDTTHLYPVSEMVSKVTSPVQPNKAIVGQNAFAHEAGIHQHGVLAHASTYEIMTPQSIGLSENKLVLGKHSGRHAFTQRLNQLGFSMERNEINSTFKAFKNMADKQKIVTDQEIAKLAEFVVEGMAAH